MSGRILNMWRHLVSGKSISAPPPQINEVVVPLEGQNGGQISVEDDAGHDSLVPVSGVDGQGVAGHRDLLLRSPDPVQHAPPARHGEGEVGAGGGGPLLDAQNWGRGNKKVGQRSVPRGPRGGEDTLLPPGGVRAGEFLCEDTSLGLCGGPGYY